MSTEELILSNCDTEEDSWESAGWQGDQPISPKGNKPWMFIGRSEAEALILLPPYEKSQLIEKDSDAGKDWRQKEKGVAEDEVVR